MPTDAKVLHERASQTFLGLSGTVWCLMAGLCYGIQNVFAKLAYERGLHVSRFIIIRHAWLFAGAYIIGKLFKKIDFDIRKQDWAVMKIVIFRSFLNLISKTMQYSAIALIPLALSSTISFTTGPIFAALLAWVLIGEHLSPIELIVIIFGILGTVMLTMPQWFLFLDIDSDEIEARLDGDLKKNSLYFVGIIIALTSSALDVLTYYIIRKVGTRINASFFPFVSGFFTAGAVAIWCCFKDPFDVGYFLRSPPADLSEVETQQYEEEKEEYKAAVMYAVIGCSIGYLALELMITGLRISKSALASYAEQVGIVVPFTFDVVFFGREFLGTDAIGLLLIVTLQATQAFISMRKSQGEMEKEEPAEKLLKVDKSDDKFKEVE